MALRIGIREGFRTITRNNSLFLLSLLVTSISLFLVSLFALVTVNLYYFLNILDEKIEIIVFLDENADFESLKSNILKINGVKDVIFIFEDNPLPASLRIKLEAKFRTANGLNEISSKIMLLRGTKETIYGGELVDQLKKITHIITVFDLGLLIIIIFSLIFVIFQTIKLTIFARSTEIEIMKLVGASNSFIAIPFTFEGVVQGLLGGSIAFILTVITNRVAISFLNDVYFPQWWFLLGNLACGFIFGIIGSNIALRKFLR